MKVTTRVLGGISVYIFAIVLWHSCCFISGLRAGYYLNALKGHFDELNRTNYSKAKVRLLWGDKAQEWTRLLLDDGNGYWKTKHKSLLSAAVADQFLDYNRLALAAARKSLELQPGYINAMEFLEDFYKKLDMTNREKACIKARKMVIESSAVENGWKEIRQCMGN